MEILFNELSFQSLAADRVEAMANMAQLSKLIRQLTGLGVQKIVRMLKHSLQQPLAPNYLISQWMNDPDVPTDDRVYFKTVAAKAPYVDDILKAYGEEHGSLFEFERDGSPALGLGAAYLLNAPAISLASAHQHFSDPSEILHRILDENANLVERMVSVCCLTTLEEVSARAKWLRERISSELAISNGVQLWNKRAIVWPNLIFCNCTRSQIEPLHGTEQFFPSLLRHLHALNRGILESTDGPLQLPGIKWSYESGPTMKNPVLARMRDFECPDGVIRSCEPHTKLLGATLRIHFFPLQAYGKAYVGYVGQHLPTAG